MRYLLLTIGLLVSASAYSLPGLAQDILSEIRHSSDPILHICVVIIIVCFSCTAIVTVLLFVHRVWMMYRQKRILNLQERYSLLLTGIIFDDEDELFDQKRKKLVSYFRKKYLRSRFSKRILRKELLGLHKSLSGPSREILETLYHELNLHKEALSQLQSTDWSEKADAVRELSQMHYLDAKNKILKLTTHENKVLRLEAQAAMLSLNTEDPFGFLEKARMELTEWQQLNLEEQAKRIDLQKIPNFAKWFGLANQSVVQFCIKMTVAYNQFESSDAVVGLLHSKDLRVVKESVKAAGIMLIDEAKQELLAIFDETTPEIQEQIIISLGKIGGEDAISFLENLLYISEPDVQIKAGVALKTIGYEADHILQKALQSENASISVIALHVLDERI